MKTYKMILTDNDGIVYAIANTVLGLIRDFNRRGYPEKLSMNDIDNNFWNIESGKFDEEGKSI